MDYCSLWSKSRLPPLFVHEKFSPYYYSIVLGGVNGQVYFVLNEPVRWFWGLTSEFAEAFEGFIFGDGVSARWELAYSRPDGWG
jgi:hypothetical protein